MLSQFLFFNLKVNFVVRINSQKFNLSKFILNATKNVPSAVINGLPTLFNV